MIRRESLLRRPDAVIDALRKSIRNRTGLQVRNLQIKLSEGRFCIHGQVPTFYTRQLVLAACRTVLGEQCSSCVEYRLEVEPLAKLREEVGRLLT